MNEPHRITLRLDEKGQVWDGRGQVLPLRIPQFHKSDPAAQVESFKLIVLRADVRPLPPTSGRRIFCDGEDLGELLSIDLDLSGEPNEEGFVTVQFPVT